MQAVPGTSTLQVSASGYASASMSLTSAAGQSVVRDIQLEPYCDVFFDNVENGPGNWQADSP